MRRAGRWAGQGLTHLASRLYTAGIPALLPVTVLFFVGAHTIYASNVAEFALPFWDLARPTLLPAAAWWAILFAPACLLPGRLARVWASVVFVLGLLLWAQGALWVGDYGVLDGTEIDFERLAWRVPYELGAWGAGLLVAVAFAGPVSRAAPFATLVFLGLQVAAVAAGPSAQGRARWTEPPPEIYQVSARQNVILVVLDEFQSDAFAELLERDRAWFDRQFGGFVYFPDHAGAFPTTSLAMPAMLTGRVYRNNTEVPQFVRDAFGDASLFQRLARHGYRVDVTSILSPAWLDDWFPARADGTRLDAIRATIRKPFVGIDDYRQSAGRQLVELSVFRHAPHVAKQAMTSSPNRLARLLWGSATTTANDERRHEASNSRAFFAHFIDRVTVGPPQPAVKLIHLGIPHRPVVLDARCAFIGLTRISREAYLGQSRCAVDLVADFLARLRQLGIYDRSLIVVASDHGTSLEPRGFAGESGSLPARAGATTPGLSSIAGTASALMLLKAPGASGPLVVSQAPTTHTDLPATIFDVLGLPGEFEGTSMLKRDATRARPREYGMYAVSQRFPEHHLARLDLITIERRLLDAEGWTYVRSILPPDLDLRAATIDCGDERANRHLGPGWSRAASGPDDAREITFVRNMGPLATMFVALPRSAVRLTARVAAAEDREQSIEIEVDGQAVGQLSARGAYRDVSILVPGDPRRPAISSVVFRFPWGAGAGGPLRFDRVSFTPN